MHPMCVVLHEVTWHGARLYDVCRMRRDGSSFMLHQPRNNQTELKYTTSKCATKKRHSHSFRITCDKSAARLPASGEKRHVKQSPSPHLAQVLFLGQPRPGGLHGVRRLCLVGQRLVELLYNILHIPLLLQPITDLHQQGLCLLHLKATNGALQDPNT